MDSLQEAVDAREDDKEGDSEEIYISIPEVSGMSLQMIFLFRCTIIR